MHTASVFKGKRVLVFVVAYNAEKTITSVLARIPEVLRHGGVDVLVIDDSSADQTFATGVTQETAGTDFNITVLRTPENQGYGGNQKLGYRYAIDNGYDIVALLHGDGQYAPEKLPDLLEPLLANEADAVFGSRMIDKRAALDGGMPAYKWVGNQVLTRFQNWILGTQFSEFHSGYRLYATQALQKIPFERNSNGFHFDTEIIVQFVLTGLRIRELPIPTYYGEEICHVDGLRYAWDVFRTMVRCQLHQRNLLYDRKFDVGPVEETYDLKIGYASSHTMAIESVRPGARVLDVGCGQGYVAAELARVASHVTGLDQYVRPSSNPRLEFLRWDLDATELPVDAAEFDQVFLLDVIEHLREPEVFMEQLRDALGGKRSEVILTTANVAFFVTRFMHLLGHFNYGRQGILDRTHTRLFTFGSIVELMGQTGFHVLEVRGIPAPFPKALGYNRISRALVAINQVLIRLSRGLFAYQIYIRAQAQPTVKRLLKETISGTEAYKHTLSDTH
jgi:glycosyltransferase involved in cell wall biosynthesis